LFHSFGDFLFPLRILSASQAEGRLTGFLFQWSPAFFCLGDCEPIDGLLFGWLHEHAGNDCPFIQVAAIGVLKNPFFRAGDIQLSAYEFLSFEPNIHNERAPHWWRERFFCFSSKWWISVFPP